LSSTDFAFVTEENNVNESKTIKDISIFIEFSESIEKDETRQYYSPTSYALPSPPPVSG